MNSTKASNSTRSVGFREEEEKAEERNGVNCMESVPQSRPEEDESRPFSLSLDEVQEYSPEQEQDLLDNDEVIRRALDHVEVVETWVTSTHRNNKRPSLTTNESKSIRAIFQKMKSRYIRRRSSMFMRDGGHFDTTLQMIEALRGLGLCLRDVYEFGGDELVCIEKSRYIVELVARIPRFIPTILLMKNEVMKREILSLPIVTRAIMSKHSILAQDGVTSTTTTVQNAAGLSESFATTTTTGRGGSSKCWLLKMLKNTSTKQHAVEYLEMISALRVTDYMRLPVQDDENEYQVVSLTPTKEDVVAFNQERLELFQAIARQEKLILRLFTLNSKDMERAGITAAVQWALHQAIQRPFMLMLVFCDFLFHMVLLMVFRHVLFRVHVNSEFDNDFLTSIVVCCILYFWFRFLVDFALIKVSWGVFWKSLTYAWSVVEISSTIMVTASWAILDHYGDDAAPKLQYFAYQAFTIGVLWLKVLGFLQIMNRTLAAYIYSMSEILVDMCWFILIMLVIILGFGDMFFTIYTVYRNPDDTGEAVCDAEDSESPFCEDNRGLSYLTIYRMFIGDVEVEQFDQDVLTTTLFVIVTFLGIIVLLNMLIAIVTTSYERSQRKSDRFFGRARIALVAKGLALEQLMKPRANVSGFNRCISIAIRLLTTLVLFYISILVGSVFYALSFLILDPIAPSDAANITSSVVSTIAALYLWIILVVYLWAGWEGQKKSRCYRFIARRWFFNCFVYRPFRFITITLLGGKPWKKLSPQEILVDDGWASQTDYTNKSTLPIFDRGTIDVTETDGEVDQRLAQVESERQSDLAASDRRAAERDAKHQSELQDIKRRAAEQEEKYVTALAAMEQRAIERDKQHTATLKERDAKHKALLAERDENYEANLREMERRLLAALKKSGSD